MFSTWSAFSTLALADRYPSDMWTGNVEGAAAGGLAAAAAAAAGGRAAVRGRAVMRICGCSRSTPHDLLPTESNLMTETGTLRELTNMDIGMNLNGDGGRQNLEIWKSENLGLQAIFSACFGSHLSAFVLHYIPILLEVSIV